MSKNTFKGHADLLLLEEKDKNHYVLIKDFNTFMYDHAFYCRRKHFYRYCLQAFSTPELLKSYIDDCLKINGKQMIKMLKSHEYVIVENYERKLKLSFMIYTYFKSI